MFFLEKRFFLNRLIRTWFYHFKKVYFWMTIWLPPLFVSLLYYAIGHFIDKGNAKYLIAGYNTLSEEKRKLFDMDNFLPFFKAFFKKQAVYSFLLFAIVKVLSGMKIAVICYALFLSIAIIYLMAKARHFYKK